MKVVSASFLLSIVATSTLSNAFTSPFPSAFKTSQSSTQSQSALQATTTDAISKLDASQRITVDKIAASIPDLQPKLAESWTSETIAGRSPTTLDARDAPGPANVAWLASVCVPDTLSSLTIFVGPLTDVPHLLSRCTVDPAGDSMTLVVDYRPRAYGAYELDESERGPDKLGRDSFTYKANRNEYSQYVTPELQSFIQSSVASLEGAQMVPIDGSEYESLTRGPFMTKVRMPLTDGNVEKVVALREQLAENWLVWATEGGHDHRPGAPVNSQYVYDSKYLQNAYLALLQDYNEAFGADGPKMSAAESGPLDEGYVGGGS